MWENIKPKRGKFSKSFLPFLSVKFKLAQINLFVGDFKHNFNKISKTLQSAQEDETDIVVFPELASTGYPPEDLLFKKGFIDDNLKLIRDIIPLCKNLICIIGFVHKDKGKLYNSAAVIYNKKIQTIYNKINLPNYSVFDEMRYFVPGDKIPIIDLGKVRFGLGICEDFWVKNTPLFKQAQSGKTDFIININASPYYINKCQERIALLKSISRKTNNHIIYLNMVGGQDEIVFDGNSLVFDNRGKLLVSGEQFKEEIIDFTLNLKEKKFKPGKDCGLEYIKIKDYKPREKLLKEISFKKVKFLSEVEEVYHALVLGTRDYIKKNGFKKVFIGLSGGIDSALTAVIAADALGPEHVETIFMPSQFSTEESFQDAKKMAENLKIKFMVLPIREIFESYMKTLNPLFGSLPFNIAEENIQARIRGNLLMACSNKFGNIVLTTGNKSEMSTGYSTLYGDLAGGFAVIKDVYKTLVYKIARDRNIKAGFELIPENIIKKEPTAELRENQKDSDSLPEYDILDRILYLYIEEHLNFNDIDKMKEFDPDTIKKVIKLVNYSEYKRRQAPPGIKITRLSFGKDRRMPITNRWGVDD